jgi:hypothetical protein
MTNKPAGRITQITVGGETFDCEPDVDSKPVFFASTPSVKTSNFSVEDTKKAIDIAVSYKKKCECDVINSILARFGQDPMPKTLGFDEVVFFVSDSQIGSELKSIIERNTPIKVTIDSALDGKGVVLMEAKDVK